MSDGPVVAEIAARASTLFERLRGEVLLDEPNADDPLVEARLDRWRQLVARGDAAAFERRLAWSGIDPRAARRALGRPRWSPARALPAWAATFGAALAVEASSASWAFEPSDRDESAPHPPASSPTLTVLTPLVVVARRRVRDRVGGVGHQLAASAWSDLERGLGTRLAGLEAALARADATASVAGRGCDAPAAGPEPPGQLLAAARRYPVLARLAATVTDRWVEAVAELVQRLAADRALLADAFLAGGDAGAVLAIDAGCSDPHRGGRTVMILTFASGLKLVYKPKDLGLDQTFAELVTWLHHRGLPLAPRAPRTVARPGYGWTEHVGQVPCEDRAAVRRYYVRAGALLALVHALGGGDFHRENLIAAGEYPTPIDFETLLQPEPLAPVPASGSAPAVAAQRLASSVVGTGLLPIRVVDPGGRVVDLSGLSGGQDWGDGSPPHHADTIIAGFRQAYAVLMNGRDELLAADGPLTRAGAHSARFVHRPTRVYEHLLHRSVAVDCLGDGAVRSIELDALSRPFVTAGAPGPFWALREPEHEALEDLDVPTFSVPVATEAIPLVNHPPAPVLGASAAAVATARIGALSEADLAWQIDVIRASIAAAGAAPDHITDATPPLGVTPSGSGVTPSGSVDSPTSPATSIDAETVAPPGRVGATTHPPSTLLATPLLPEAPLLPEQLVSLAVELAEGLGARSVHGDDGSVAWIGLVHLPPTGPTVGPPTGPTGGGFELRPLGFDLYNGAAGVALFFAALACVVADGPATGAGSGRERAGRAPDSLARAARRARAERGDARRRWHELALGALLPLRQALAAQPGRLADELGLGGGTGLGSLVYALARVGGLVGETGLLADAHRAAAQVTPLRIAATHDAGLLSGLAGTALGLLALADDDPSGDVLARAVACGRRLAALGEAQVTDRPETRPSLAGFASGAAGTAYALLRLAERTAEPSFRTAAEALARGSLAPSSGDVRWCRGAAGTLAGALPGAPRSEALDQLLAPGRTGTDDLCCGSLGVAEALLSAGMRLDRPDLVTAAGRLAAGVAGRAAAEGGWRLYPSAPGSCANPGLFRGLAGIGYQLLRLARPDLVPSVLVWE